jgi:hypothetical protein
MVEQFMPVMLGSCSHQHFNILEIALWSLHQFFHFCFINTLVYMTYCYSILYYFFSTHFDPSKTKLSPSLGKSLAQHMTLTLNNSRWDIDEAKCNIFSRLGCKTCYMLSFVNVVSLGMQEWLCNYRFLNL